MMDKADELERLKIYNLNKLVDYVPNKSMSQVIVKKITGHVVVSSHNKGEKLVCKVSPFDNLVYLIDGRAEVVINTKDYILCSGDGIIIPANSSCCFNAQENFKMICTVIKSGYENV